MTLCKISIALLFVACGCSHPAQVATPEPSARYSPEIQALASEAKLRGFHWKIWHVDSGYQALAWYNCDMEDIENPCSMWWAGTGESANSAADNLTSLLKQNDGPNVALDRGMPVVIAGDSQ